MISIRSILSTWTQIEKSAQKTLIDQKDPMEFSEK